jgi:hypothetical protein
MTEPTSNLMTALLAVQAEAPKLQKDKINPAFRSKYLSLDALMEQVLPVLNKHKLVWITRPGQDSEGRPVLSYELAFAVPSHFPALPPPPKDGGWSETKVTVLPTEAIKGTMPLMLSKQDAQGLGSAITYARRYSLMAVLGLVADEDDDGAKASRRPQRVETTAGPRPPAPVEQPTRVLPRHGPTPDEMREVDEAKRTLAIHNSPRLLTAEEMQRMMEAIETSGKEAPLLFAAVGLDSPDGVNVEHAKAIARLLAA